MFYFFNTGESVSLFNRNAKIFLIWNYSCNSIYYCNNIYYYFSLTIKKRVATSLTTVLMLHTHTHQIVNYSSYKEQQSYYDCTIKMFLLNLKVIHKITLIWPPFICTSFIINLKLLKSEIFFLHYKFWTEIFNILHTNIFQ